MLRIMEKIIWETVIETIYWAQKNDERADLCFDLITFLLLHLIQRVLWKGKSIRERDALLEAIGISLNLAHYWAHSLNTISAGDRVFERSLY